MKKLIFISLILLVLTACGSKTVTQYSSIEELAGKRIGVAYGYGADISVTNLGIYQVHRFMYGTDLPMALRAGNIDAFVMERSEAELYTQEFSGLKILPGILGHEYYVAICNKKNAVLAGEIDTAIGEIMNSPIFSEMKDRWLNGDLDSAVMPDIPRGTGEKLVVTISTEYMPFEYFGEGGERLGFDVELIWRIGALLNREIEFFETSYLSAFAAIDSGYADVYISVVVDMPALRDKYAVSRPYCDNVVVMVAADGQNSPRGFIEGIKHSINSHLFVEKRFTYIIEGLLSTLIIFGIAAFFGTLLGALLCAMIRGKRWLLNKTAALYVRFIQGTPIIVLLLFFTYVAFAGSGINTIVVSGITFSLYFAARASEIFRAGLDSVEKDQIEAAKAMGLSGLQTYRLVLAPQSAIFSLPVYCADLVEMLKLTSVVGYVGVMDLTYALEVIRSRTYETMFPLLLETLIYILLTSMLTRLFRSLSSKIDPLKKERRIRL